MTERRFPPPWTVDEMNNVSSLSAIRTGSSLVIFISRMSPAGALPPICSPRTRRGGWRSTSSSCRSCCGSSSGARPASQLARAVMRQHVLLRSLQSSFRCCSGLSIFCAPTRARLRKAANLRRQGRERKAAGEIAPAAQPSRCFIYRAACTHREAQLPFSERGSPRPASADE